VTALLIALLIVLAAGLLLPTYGNQRPRRTSPTRLRDGAEERK
jgi:hypothetical protein